MAEWVSLLSFVADALAGWASGYAAGAGNAGLATRGILFSNSVPSSENIEKADMLHCFLFIGCPALEPILRAARA